jgi:hypothetical protein
MHGATIKIPKGQLQLILTLHTMEINTFLTVGLQMKYRAMVERIGLQCQNA